MIFLLPVLLAKAPATLLAKVVLLVTTPTFAVLLAKVSTVVMIVVVRLLWLFKLLLHLHQLKLRRLLLLQLLLLLPDVFVGHFVQPEQQPHLLKLVQVHLHLLELLYGHL